MKDAVRQWLRAARRIVLLSGAGMSAESGVPTFRDAQSGLWAGFRPEELATEERREILPTEHVVTERQAVLVRERLPLHCIQDAMSS